MFKQAVDHDILLVQENIAAVLQLAPVVPRHAGR